MGWGQIFKVNSDLTTPLNVTLGNKSNVAGESASDTMFSFIKNINTNLVATLLNTQKSQIKSIQRGTVGYVTTNDYYVTTRSITISSVNLSKSILIINTVTTQSPIKETNLWLESAYKDRGMVHLSSPTTITQSGGGYGGIGGDVLRMFFPAFAWQVIEFY